ncbi:YhcH/YjgK/YiaL family protein [Xylanibacter brevis]|jgi:YhcH/YjgK/YiaL family protein|uniref:YhcH/YjgK/YiaL family protein n=1 Tax=Xylanibacter brevis TaxID=83231 RepID=UPI0004874823|nr:YhcH/YjgK/YiaL family protein [Xylanibacter brevis]
MIIDTLENLEKYVAVNPLFKKVVAFLRENDLMTLAEGKHVIDGDDLFVNIQVAKGKTPDEAVIETHRKMVDIQIPLDGMETYGYTPLCNLPDVPYQAEKDITKYPGQMADSFIDCQPGMFAVFFPQDGHAPCISMAPTIKKAIFKVKA